MTIVAGRTYRARSASTCFRPSSAERTEIAGVIIGVAREQGRPDDPEEKGQRRLLSERALRERLERKDAALALVVGQHQEQAHIFR